jgi:hypothetical protein
MKSLRVAAAVIGLLAAAFAGPVFGSPSFFDFTARFDNGPLRGSNSTGVVTVDGNDCPANICTGIFTPGNVLKTLFSFDITVGGIHFTLNNDSPPLFPQVGFDAGGHLNFLNYDGLAAGNELIILGNLNNPAAVTFIPATGQISTGTAAAPEPGTASLLGGILLAGFAFGWLRKRGTDGRSFA